MARVTRETYLRAGLEILGEHGSEGLTVPALCERLAITKGSFYHHFESLPAFYTAVLAYWEHEHTVEPIARLSDVETDAIWQVPQLTETAVALPHATEAALRAWGTSNAEVAACQARVDASRQERIRQVLIAVGVEAKAAGLLADTAVSVLVGFQHRPPLDVARLRAMLGELNRLIYLEAGD